MARGCRRVEPGAPDVKSSGRKRRADADVTVILQRHDCAGNSRVEGPATHLARTREVQCPARVITEADEARVRRAIGGLDLEGGVRRQPDVDPSCQESVCMCPLGTEEDYPRFSPKTRIADINVVAADGEIDAGSLAERDIAAAAGIVKERLYPDSRVLRANGVAIKRINPIGRVEASGVEKECLHASGRVLGAGSVAIKCVNTIGRVVGAAGIVGESIGTGGCILRAIDVVKKGINAIGRVVAGGGVAEERLQPGGGVLRACGVTEKGAEPIGGVIIAGGVVIEGLKTEGGIVNPAAQAKERRSSLRGVVAGIAAIRRRTDRQRHLAKRKAHQHERYRDKKETTP